MGEMPLVHAWVAIVLPCGRLSRSQMVPLSATEAYLKAGYMALVDPAEQEAMLAWENEQAAERFTNNPRLE